MISIERFRRSPKMFPRLVDLSPKQFDETLHDLENAWETAGRERLIRKERTNKIDGVRCYEFDLGGMLLITLVYLRHYLSGRRGSARAPTRASGTSS